MEKMENSSYFSYAIFHEINDLAVASPIFNHLRLPKNISNAATSALLTHTGAE